MIQMLVTDIDGTILDDRFNMSEGVLKCIEKLKLSGIKVILATGRMFASSLPIAKRLGLNTPIICYQGALIQDVNNEILYKKNVKKEFAIEIIDYLREKNFHINTYIDDELIVEQDNDIVKRYAKERLTNYKVVKDLKSLDFVKSHKILAIKYDKLEVAKIENELKEMYKDKLFVTRSTPYFCEISNIEASKGKAINFLSKNFRIDKEDIMAIGDQDNDIDLLESAKIGVAMGNGSSKLKEIATYTTRSVKEDGFVRACEKFIFV